MAERQQHRSRRSSAAFATRMALLLTTATLLVWCVLAVLYANDKNAVNSHEDKLTSSSSSSSWMMMRSSSSSSSSYQRRALLQDGNNNNNDNNNDDDSDKDYSTYSCHYIFDITPNAGTDQCHFAQECNGHQGVWAPWVFCWTRAGSSTVWAALLSPFMLLWMIILFRMLASTAEDYFSPALEMFSLKLGLPPRFAGVSLLALGNGAADVSATVSAITSDPQRGYDLALGALTGAAMFISAVVSAVVVLAADGVPCRGALVRDVTMLALTVSIVWFQLSNGGSVGPDTMSLFLSLYIVFVILVLVADIYHRAVVVPRLAVQAQEQERTRQMQEAQRMGGISAAITALSNYDNQNVPQGGWGVESEELEQPIVLHGRDGLLRNPHHNAAATPGSPGPTHTEPDEGGAYRMLDNAVDRVCVDPGSMGMPADDWQDALQDGQEELREHAETVWMDIVSNDEGDGNLRVLTQFLLVCELPFTVLRKMTVPIPCEGYYVRALVSLSLAVSPLWLAYYLWHSHNLNVFSQHWIWFLLSWAALCLVALCVLRLAPGGEGSMALGVSTPIALYGFVLAATWIDTIADALVSLLNFIGIILRIPGPIIGLTILAWGNSMGDLSANVTMARKGLGNMAMTACFAGPVFNILVGLGLGFGTLAAQTGNAETEVSLSPSVVTGFAFLLVNALLFLGTGLVVGQGRIYKTYGYLALTIYSVYLITSLSVQYAAN